MTPPTQILTEIKDLHDTGVERGAWDPWWGHQLRHAHGSWRYMGNLIDPAHALAIVRDLAEGMLMERKWWFSRLSGLTTYTDASGHDYLALANALRVEMERAA